MREGLIPTLLGTGVAATTGMMRARDIRKRGMQKQNVRPMVETALLGFGVAHVVLGAIDLIQDKNK